MPQTKPAAGCAEVEATPDSEAGSKNPSNRSAAILQALLELGDPDVPARQVREYIVKKWPHLRKATESRKHWNAYVTQCREKAAEQLGVQRTGRQGRRPGFAQTDASPNQRITVDDLLELAQIRSKLKNEGDLVEVVQLVLKLGPEPRLKKMLGKYTELAKRHDDDAEKIERFLLEARELGLNWDG